MNALPHTTAAIGQGPHGVPLTPYERILYDVHEAFPAAAVFTAAARFRGRIDPDRLDRALQAVQRRHPFLRAGVIQVHGKPVYDVVDDAPPIPVEWIETADRERWIEETLNRARVPFDARRPPFLRVAVLQGPDTEWCDVLFTMYHLVADGRAMMSILWDLQFIWSAAKSGPVSLPVQEWSPPQMPPYRGSWLSELRRWRQGRGVRRLQPLLPKARFEKLSPAMVALRREVLTEAETRSLRGRCREAETTLYGALAAAMTRSLAADPRHAGCRFRVNSPLDIRALCEPRVKPDQLGCYVWIMKYEVAAPERTPFWELARQCREGMEAARQNDAVPREWSRLAWLLPLFNARRIEARNRRLESGLVSINEAGAIRQPPECRDLVLEEFGWYSNREYTVPTIVINAVMIDGRLNLSINSPCHTSEQLAALAAEIRRQLDTPVVNVPAPVVPAAPV